MGDYDSTCDLVEGSTNSSRVDIHSHSSTPQPERMMTIASVAAPAVEAAAAKSGYLQRVFTPNCDRCGATFPAPHRSLPPKWWDCIVKGCSGKLWQPDDASQVCDLCGVAVGRFTRHHCRRCGYLTCARCLVVQSVFIEWSATEKQRVCWRCAVPEVPVAMSGSLRKLSQRSTFFGDRNPGRYFELRGTVLLYGRAKDGGELSLSQSESRHSKKIDRKRQNANLGNLNGESSGDSSGLSTQRSPGVTALKGMIDVRGAKLMDVAIHPHAFCIVGPRLPCGCILSAPNVEEKGRWVEAIKEQVKQQQCQHRDQKGDGEEFEEDLGKTERVLYTVSGMEENPSISMHHFELLTVIGLGGFGRVMKVRHKSTGKIYAMKILEKHQVYVRKMVTHTNAEKLILSEISHPFVVKLYYAFQTKRHLVLVLEFLCGGELFFHLQRNKRFSEKRARFYAAEIGMAVEYIHGMNVMYRDLKPENLMLDRDGHVVLTDFGLAKREVSGEERTHTFCGTPEYMAPELVHKSGHTSAVDWWSLGVFLYEMVHGMPPFYSENVSVMYDMILHKPLVCPPSFSSELKKLLGRLLEKDPAKRLRSGAEFRAHPFFKGLDFDKLFRREIKPEFVPSVKQNDIRYFDKRFLRESTRIAQLDQPCDPSDPVSRAFEGFDFNVGTPAVTSFPDEAGAEEERRVCDTSLGNP